MVDRDDKRPGRTIKISLQWPLLGCVSTSFFVLMTRKNGSLKRNIYSAILSNVLLITTGSFRVPSEILWWWWNWNSEGGGIMWSSSGSPRAIIMGAIVTTSWFPLKVQFEKKYPNKSSLFSSNDRILSISWRVCYYYHSFTLVWIVKRWGHFRTLKRGTTVI